MNLTKATIFSLFFFFLAPVLWAESIDISGKYLVKGKLTGISKKLTYTGSINIEKIFSDKPSNHANRYKITGKYNLESLNGEKLGSFSVITSLNKDSMQFSFFIQKIKGITSRLMDIYTVDISSSQVKVQANFKFFLGKNGIEAYGAWEAEGLLLGGSESWKNMVSPRKKKSKVSLFLHIKNRLIFSYTNLQVNVEVASQSSLPFQINKPYISIRILDQNGEVKKAGDPIWKMGDFKRKELQYGESWKGTFEFSLNTEENKEKVFFLSPGQYHLEIYFAQNAIGKANFVLLDRKVRMRLLLNQREYILPAKLKLTCIIQNHSKREEIIKRGVFLKGHCKIKSFRGLTVWDGSKLLRVQSASFMAFGKQKILAPKASWKSAFELNLSPLNLPLGKYTLFVTFPDHLQNQISFQVVQNKFQAQLELDAYEYKSTDKARGNLILDNRRGKKDFQISLGEILSYGKIQNLSKKVIWSGEKGFSEIDNQKIVVKKGTLWKKSFEIHLKNLFLLPGVYTLKINIPHKIQKEVEFRILNKFASIQTIIRMDSQSYTSKSKIKIFVEFYNPSPKNIFISLKSSLLGYVKILTIDRKVIWPTKNKFMWNISRHLIGQRHLVAPKDIWRVSVDLDMKDKELSLGKYILQFSAEEEYFAERIVTIKK